MHNKKIYQGLLILSLIMIVSVIIYLEHNSNHSSLLLTIKCTLNSDKHTNCVSSWFNEQDGAYYIFLPAYSDKADITLSYMEDYELYINSQRYDQYDKLTNLSLNNKYSVKLCRNGTLVDKGRLFFMKSNNIGAMFISTDTGSMKSVHKNKNNKEGGNITFYTEEGSVNYSGKMKYITGRGNNTWGYDKKPYNIKLSEPVNLLNMGSSDSWCLLANYNDKTNLRNKLVYDFADKIGLDYSPDSNFTDLYLNGQYMGLYLLSEEVELGDNRVDIGETGVLLGIEAAKSRFDLSKYKFVTDNNHMIVIHSETDKSEDQIAKIQTIIQETEDAIKASNGINNQTQKHYSEYIDVNSWVKKYIIDEVFANYDSQWSSQYFYMTENSKLYAGPVWDYDLSIGLPESSPATSNPRAFTMGWRENLYVSPILWYKYLYNDNEFKGVLVQTYDKVVQPVLQEYITETIPSCINQIRDASRMNAVRWKVADYNTGNKALIDYLRIHSEFLTDVWINGKDYCTIYFVSEIGKDMVYNYAVESGESLEEIPIPAAEGYIFDGWYDSSTNKKFNIYTPITRDTAIYAKWTEKTLTGIKADIKKYYEVIPALVVGILSLSISAVEVYSIWIGKRKYRSRIYNNEEIS